MEIIALLCQPLWTIGAKGGPDHIDLLLCLGRHQEIGI